MAWEKIGHQSRAGADWTEAREGLIQRARNEYDHGVCELAQRRGRDFGSWELLRLRRRVRAVARIPYFSRLRWD